MSSSSTTTTMTTESPGRERAMELLMDMEPQGPLYRASRLVDETIPRALQSRPNFIPKTALVDKAYSLCGAEIDTVREYLAVFAPSLVLEETPKKTNTNSENDHDTTDTDKDETRKHVDHDEVDALVRTRLARHFDRILQAESSITTTTPVGGTRTLALLDPLLDEVLGHANKDGTTTSTSSTTTSTTTDAKGRDDPTVLSRRLWHDQDASASTATTTRMSLTQRVGQACLDPSVSSLVLAALSVLESIMGHTTESGGGSTTPSNSSSPPTLDNNNSLVAVQSMDDLHAASLPVGAMLSLLPQQQQQCAAAVDTAWLHYLGTAAAVWEERLELQQEPQRQVQSNEYDNKSTWTPLPEETTSANEEDANDEDTNEGNANDEDANHDDESEPSSDDESHAYEALPSLLMPDDPSSNSSSSSSSSSSDSSSQGQVPQEEEDDDDEDDDDELDDEFIPDDDEEEEAAEEEEEEMLREALALSLDDHALLFPAATERDDVERARDEDDEDSEEDNIETDDDEELPELQPPTVLDSSSGEEAGDATPPRLTPEPLLVSQENQETVPEEMKDEVVLPPLPTPPPEYPYRALLDSSIIHDPDGANDEANSYTDPSSFAKFGVIPSSRVLLHLLDSTMLVIQGRQADALNSETDELAVVHSIPGGTGCVLFPPRDLSQPSLGTIGEWDSEYSTALQLLVSLLVILEERQTRVFHNLRDIMSQEEAKEPEDDDPLTGEDDPALAMAMNYVEESTSPTECFEALEAKGMKRKAAAAAHDAALRSKRIQIEIQAWRERAKLLSRCTLRAVQCLRAFLQSTVLSWLRQDCTSFAPEGRTPALSDLCSQLPSGVRARLSLALDSLTSVRSFECFSALLVGDEMDEVSEVPKPLELYREAIITWAECFPLVHPEADARAEILESLLRGQTGSLRCGVDGLREFPWSEREMRTHRLHVLCRRLCVSDLLNDLVPHPVSCHAKSLRMQKGGMFEETEGSKMLNHEFRGANSLVGLLRLASTLVEGPEASQVERLFRAVCHRCNLHLVLWDGLYSCSQEDSDVSVSPLHAVVMSASGSVRINPSPSDSILFDSSKCSDSIAILSNAGDSGSSGNGCSALQRASKVWGTVLSGTSYTPKSGVHRWAIRLDKCERGHVFIGVATAQATLRTYVGGDKYGWGVIGTQALWHDRRKTRGDYGATFRTGATIIVTLDTDAGTLSYSSWKDGSATPSFSVDPLLATLTSPRRHGQETGGTLEDWGVAFEGLPLDSRLYPAVGLYQRDDRVTLLCVESDGESTVCDGDVLGGGQCYYPKIEESKISLHRHVVQLRRHNNLLSWDGVQYCIDALFALSEGLRVRDVSQRFRALVHGESVASSLCLIPPAIPVLSQRFALHTLPHLSRCIRHVTDALSEEDELFSNGLVGGKWMIRATGSNGNAGSEYEEYIVSFRQIRKDGVRIGFQGSGVGTTGKSKNGVVNIFGTLEGSALHFVEEWKDGIDDKLESTSDDTSSSCAVNGRLNLTGDKFEGSYRNEQYGTSGQICGMRVAPLPFDDHPQGLHRPVSLASCRALLCLAHGHLACILTEDFAGDHVQDLEDGTRDSVSPSHISKLDALLNGPLLSIGSHGERLGESVGYLKRLYSPPRSWQGSVDLDEPFAIVEEMINEEKVSSSNSSSLHLESIVGAIDDEMISLSGGKGSFHSLCPDEFHVARQKIVAATIHHSGNLQDSLQSFASNPSSCHPCLDDFTVIWRSASAILDSRVRRILSESTDNLEVQKTRREDACHACAVSNQISSLLLGVIPQRKAPISLIHLLKVLSESYSLFDGERDLMYLENEMERARGRALLCMMSLRHTCDTLPKVDEDDPRLRSKSLVFENLVVIAPRLVSRSWSRTRVANGFSDPSDGIDLGGHYLSNLSGSGSIARGIVSRLVHRMYVRLGAFLRSLVSGGVGETESSFISTSLAILAAYSVSIRVDDAIPIVEESGLVETLFRIFSLCRGCIGAQNSVERSDEEASEIMSLEGLCDSLKRDTLRSVFRAALSVAHILTFQLSRHLFRADGWDSKAHARVLESCLRLLLGEMEWGVPFIETLLHTELASFEQIRATEEWNKFASVGFLGGFERSAGKDREKRAAVTESGLKFFLRRGTSSHSFRSGPQKPGFGSRAGVFPDRGMSTHASLEHSCHEYISQLLNWLCCIVTSGTARRIFVKNIQCVDILLKAIGLSCTWSACGRCTNWTVRSSVDSTSCLLPGRYRARIIRLLVGVIPELDASEILVSGLFNLVGACHPLVDGTKDVDRSYVSREVLSLLRGLHSCLSPNWRAAINGVLSSNIQRDHERTTEVQVGCLAFLSGSISAVEEGSFVLLKPAPASLIASFVSSAGSSKAHGSSAAAGTGNSTIPHHVVGNGTAGMVAGICRGGASAGVVSGVDIKNGLCEVILLERRHDPMSDEISTSQTPAETRSPRGASWGRRTNRHALSVRAVRTPLTDVACAEEVSLCLDAELPFESLLGLLPSTLDSVSEGVPATVGTSGDDMKSDGDVVGRSELDACTSLLTLRSAAVLLSDESLVKEFIRRESSGTVLSKVLEHASSGGSNHERADSSVEMASLPGREARFSFLISVLRELRFRESLLDETRIALRLDLLSSYLSGSASEDTKEKLSNAENEQVPSTPLGNASEQQEQLGRVSSQAEGRTSRSGRQVSQSSVGSSSTVEEDDGEAAVTAAAHLREAAIAQMAELGLPRPWSELALRRTGGTNIEAAVHFCLERGGDMERLLAEERERERIMQRQIAGGSPVRRHSSRDAGAATHLLQQLLEMGFPRRWCSEALSATGDNVDEALTWILTNGERLSAEDEGGEEEDDVDDGDGEETDEDEEQDEGVSQSTEVDTANHSSGEMLEEARCDLPVAPASASHTGETTDSTAYEWGCVLPLRFISGRSKIDPGSLSVSGLPSGGFSSVGTKGVMLTEGKWYYEAILETSGCLQVGWADGSFAGHCNADRGDGCGDGPSSWAYDGWRRYRWHASATEWGCRWKEGDVIGCLVDMDEHVISFTLNGRGEEIGMGVAFSGAGFRPCGGVYACVSFNRREKLRLILGGRNSVSFKHQPPPGYKGVGEAVLDRVDELDKLLKKEEILNVTMDANEEEGGAERRFLCDFSDGEHGHELFAWQHRYYGSDASVHLGSGRSSKNSSEVIKQVDSGESSLDLIAMAYLSKRLDDEWSNNFASLNPESFDNVDDCEREIESRMRDGYGRVGQKLVRELHEECQLLSTLYSRKLVMHLMIAVGDALRLRQLIPLEKRQHRENELEIARQLWTVVADCTSLRTAGWVGEAGAMALAAEALGLGISSSESPSRYRTPDRTPRDNGESVILPQAGVSQLLSTVLTTKSNQSSKRAGTRDTGRSLAACAEASLGGHGGGGALIFLRSSLQSIARHSGPFRELIVAVIRRSVRVLAAVDLANDDSSSPDNIENHDLDVSSSPFNRPTRSREPEEDLVASYQQPDARLVSFLTGLLLSPPVLDWIKDRQSVLESLFQAWSIGLLSGSMPWRMISAYHAAGVLDLVPEALASTVDEFPSLAQFYGRLTSSVVRRVWAERAAVPVCSRYVQAMIELLSCVRKAERHMSLSEPSFTKAWNEISVDSATPLPSCRGGFSRDYGDHRGSWWECQEGWISSDASYDVWLGSVECMPVDWSTPSKSAVRTLMDGGDGPPMLREGCSVMRGIDWADDCQEDGKDAYELEKAARDKTKEADHEDQNTISEEPVLLQDDEIPPNDTDPAFQEPQNETSAQSLDQQEVAAPSETSAKSHGERKKKRRKVPNPKLPVGIVTSIEPWNGVPGVGRHVKWLRTGAEGVYRYGGDGGRYDLSHVEVNGKSTRVKKRHPLPESKEQIALRHGFGGGRRYCVLLRLRRDGSTEEDDELLSVHEGLLEWPDFGAGVRVKCDMHADGAVTLTELELLYGSKDSGWEARFGQPSFVPGSVVVLSPTGSLKTQAELDARSSFLSMYEELLGSSSFAVEQLRDRADGSKICVVSEMRLYRGRRVSTGDNSTGSSPTGQTTPLPPIQFDRNYHAPSVALSRDGRTVTCVSPDGRASAFASVGFTRGVHYWEVKIEQGDIGSIFVGVAEKPDGAIGSSSSMFRAGSLGDTGGQPRLNRWHGWGFVNFRATFTSGAERVYGAHCHSGDTIGVMLDCDAGRVSYFFDGLKYGEHILNDLGCAFENLSPFGFNADGCGSGGAGQGAPSGIEGGRSGRYPAQGSIRPLALWPVVGLRNLGDRVTFSTKWMTSPGVDGVSTLRNVLAVDELLSAYSKVQCEANQGRKALCELPRWFIEEAFLEYRRWNSDKWQRSNTRGGGPLLTGGSGVHIDVDASPVACAAACAAIGLNQTFLPGDRVRIKRSAGRILELAEEAVILGVYAGRLFYQIVSQKSEGGSLTEGGGRAWFWEESEVVDDSLEPLEKLRGLGLELPLLDRFKCIALGGLKIIYEGGAVIRTDLEIFDGSVNIGTIPFETIIPQNDVLQRRVNSCGVIRYQIRYNDLEGWISSNIRGGKEESIVEPVTSGTVEETAERSYRTPLECAVVWYERFKDKLAQGTPADKSSSDQLAVHDIEQFERLLEEATFSGFSVLDSDTLLASVASAVADFTRGGDVVRSSFEEMASVLSLICGSRVNDLSVGAGVHPGAYEAATALIAKLDGPLPKVGALMARIAMLRALNKRARVALPWLSARSGQEGSAIFGGLHGYGSSVERAARSARGEVAQTWFQAPSLSSRVRDLRGLLFFTVKRSYVDSIISATTTPTPLSHDEYELPREIRTVRVNRLKARRAMSSDDDRIKRKHSIFSQLHSETRSWGGAALRRGFVAKGHGGQKRAFKVKLVSEGVNDYSGPYREAFTDAFHEIVDVNASARGSLGVLDPTPNNASDIGEHRELFMFSTADADLMRSCTTSELLTKEELRIRKHFAVLTLPRDEATREVEESLVFLGRLVGTACRHGIPVDLPLPMSTVWKAMTEQVTTEQEKLEELDLLASRLSEDEAVTMLLRWQQRMLNSFVDGMSSVLPMEALTLLTGKELRDFVCGNPDVDVDLLKRVVEYEGFEATDSVIQYFWEVLREMSSANRKKFLQFVWARSALPMRESEFEAPFKIQRDNTADGEALPSASTCFFSLSLPNYSSKETLKQKLLFAIENVCTMESDYVTNDAEIGEGWRGL